MDLEFLEESDILGDGVASDGLHATVDAPQAEVGEELLIRGIVAITIEDHLPVLVQGLRGDRTRTLSSFDRIRKVLKGLGGDSG